MIVNRKNLDFGDILLQEQVHVTKEILQNVDEKQSDQDGSEPFIQAFALQYRLFATRSSEVGGCD